MIPIKHEIIEIFSPLWWKTNLITIGIIVLILLIANLCGNKKRELLAKFIGFILLLDVIGIHFYLVHLEIWSIHDSLPLHLCGLSAILSALVLFWRNQLAYECLYYWGIVGAFHSLLTPELTMGMQGLLIYDYFISHGGIILSAIYLTWIVGMRPRAGSWWNIFLFSQLLIPVIGSINWFLDSNYMYLCIKPEANNPFLIGPWPWYIVGIELAAIVHFFIVYSPFILKKKLISTNGSTSTI